VPRVRRSGRRISTIAGCLRLDQLLAANDVVLNDRDRDPAETTNLAAGPTNQDLVARYSAKPESLIDAEIGGDNRARVAERPPTTPRLAHLER
jgi:hypothetical protein